MTTENDLYAARQCAKHWARRYQAAQALIEELQGERETRRIESLRYEARLYLSQRAEARRWSAAWKAAAKRHRKNVSDIIENMARDEAIQNKRNKSAIDGDTLPGAGLLGPYTPPGVDPIQGVEDSWWIGCESWETWEGEE